MGVFLRNIIIILSVALTIPVVATGQHWGSTRKKNKFNLWDDWSFNVNMGRSSFYGDVSIYDDSFSDKLSKESDWAYGLIVRKHINPIIAVGTQILFGKLKGENTRAKFEGDIVEYNLHATINIVNLILRNNKSPFYVYGMVGAGQFLFSSKKFIFTTPGSEEEKEDTGTPEFVYMFGAEGSLQVAGPIDVSIGIVLRQARNDKIDVTKKKDDWDYYAYLSAGITYNLRSKNSTSRNYKNIRGRYPMRRK
ncbi:MAG: porin family protein [Bacteroidales bacterium]|nr:porin family protein [Bacteroidales bacterium]